MNKSLPLIYLTSVLSSATSEFITYPFDLLKTRMQIQGQPFVQCDGRQFSNKNIVTTILWSGKCPILKTRMTRMACEIARNEGYLGLWAGFLPMMLRQLVYCIVPYTIFSHLPTHLSTIDAYFPSLIIVGTLTGAISGVVTNPLEVIKVKMQMAGIHQQGHLSMIETFKREYKRAGAKGLWRNRHVNKKHYALVQMSYISHYVLLKRYLLKHTGLQEGWLLHGISSVCTGFLAAVISTPSDVITTRLCAQPVNVSGKGLYFDGFFDCLKKSIKHGGVSVLYTGFLPNWIRLTPWAFIFWLSHYNITAFNNLD